MLEQLRQNSRSFIIWILFGIIIAVFIVSFGPQAGPDNFACGGSGRYAVKVGDRDVSAHSWRFAYNGMALFRQFPGGGPVRRYNAIDTVVERELLAQEAEKSGFQVSTDLVNERIQAGFVYIGGFLLNGRQLYFPDEHFDYDTLERFVLSSLSLPSVPYYIEEQRREILADMMRTRLMGSVTVSSEEARSQYIQENTKIKVDYVKFDPNDYARKMVVNEAAVEAYAKDHEQDLKKDFERSKASYEKQQNWVLARHILIKKDTEPKPKPPEDKGEEPKQGEPPLPPKEEAPAEKKTGAKQRIEAIAKRIAGGEKFGAVAAEVSEDDKSKLRGGSLGWRPATSLGWGKELVEAAKDLEPGKLSQPIESQYGYHLLWIDERTDKGLTFEQKKLDLAALAAPRYYAEKRAQLDANAALAAVQGKNLADVYDRATGAGIPGQPQLTPEQLDELRRQMQEQMNNKPGAPAPSIPLPVPTPGGNDEGGDEGGDGDETGWIIREGPNVLAQIGSDEEEKKSEQPDDEAEDRAAPPAAGATSGAPKSPPKGGPDGVLAAPDGSEMRVPVDENIPEVGEMDPPRTETVGPVSRQGDSLAGIGRAPELVRSLFDEVAVGSIGSQVYEVEGSYFVVQLVERTDADMEKFPEQEAEIKADLRQGKGIQLLAEWLETRCRDAAKAGSIEVARDVLYEDPDSQKIVQYTACQYVNLETVLGQQRSRLLSDLY